MEGQWGRIPTKLRLAFTMENKMQNSNPWLILINFILQW